MRDLRRRLAIIWGRPSLRRRALLITGAVFLGLALFLTWWLRPFWQLAGQFDQIPFTQPSRVYGRSLTLSRGGYLDPKNLGRHLESLGYRADEGGGRPAQGRYRIEPDRFEVFLRSFPAPAGWVDGQVLSAELAGNRITALTFGDRAVDAAPLEPPLIASYFGEGFIERRPLRLERVPKVLIEAVVAAEDENFFRHGGVSLRGIVRALWANLRGSTNLQGGSTLTQQLVKNLYLTNERTVERKVQESIIALFLDLRYSKEQILEAYLNEIFLGTAGGANLHGFGAAARAYFGKDLAELSLAEAATLVGLIPAPAKFSPLAHPEKALERRNLVLGRLLETEAFDARAIALARDEPLSVSPQPRLIRRAPYFEGVVAEEVARRYGVADLADAGYAILATLSLSDQRAAEEAVAWGIATLEKGPEKKAKTASPLQAAIFSLDPRDGGILAYVGGRDFTASQFDRVAQARRQAGSAFKPVVFATALEEGVVTPASLLEDAPLTVELAGQRWSPQNDDDEFQGWVTVRTALEKSLNVPTARVALTTGLPKIVAMARALGITTPLEPYPALALGAFEVSPLELATVYATLAAGGSRPPVHAVNAVLNSQGQALAGEALPAREQVISRQTAYLVTSLLQGVVARGTGTAVREAGLADPLAGKTGTTNGRRDSWFAGYAPSRATVVWVGYDDNTATRLSGSRAALPIWARFTRAARPGGGYPAFTAPAGVVSVAIDPETGELATERCPTYVVEVFDVDHQPTVICSLHRGAQLLPEPGVELPAAVGEAPVESPRRESPLRRWLKRIFGKEKNRQEERKPPG